MIRTIADRVLIEPIATSDKTSGGIIIPESAREKSSKGIIRAVGQSRMYQDDVELFEGDTVLFEPNAGIPHEEDGIIMRLMKRGNVIAKL